MNWLAEVDALIGDAIESCAALFGVTALMVVAWIAACEAITAWVAA
jgi:hypothetical protein